MRTMNSSSKLLVADNDSTVLPTVGFIFICLILIVGATLALQDAFYMVFAIPLSAMIGIAAMQDKGNINSNAETIGLGVKNLPLSIAYGFMGAAISLIVGSILIGLNIAQASIFMPDLSATASILVGSVIPSNYILMADIVSQWFIVAPSEEAGFRIVLPYAIETIIPSAPVMFGVSILMWCVYHYPTWVLSNTDPNMYYVIIIWGILWVGLLLLTKSFFASTVAHASTNSAILLINYSIASMTVILVVLMILGIGLYTYAQKS